MSGFGDPSGRVSAPTHSDLGEIYTANVVGGVSLLRALSDLRPKPRLFIVASSAAVYAGNLGDQHLKEDSPIRPSSHYGLSKWTLEQQCKVFEGELPIQIVRPFNYTGVGQTTKCFVPKVVEHFAMKRRALQVGNIELVRDISSVSEVVECYLRMLELGEVIGPINICSGVGVKLADVVEIAAGLSGHRLEVIENPSFVRLDETPRIVGSVGLLDLVVGRFRRIPIDEIVGEMLKNYVGWPKPNG